MENQRVQYIRKNGRKKGHKKGVLYCGLDPDDRDKSVLVGFTLCHSIDRFDYMSGIRQSGFGLDIARQRAEKWKFHTDYFVQKTYTEPDIFNEECALYIYINPNLQEVVEVPPSVMVILKPFIERCRKYYKDKEFPVWIQKIESGVSYPKDKLEWNY